MMQSAPGPETVIDGLPYLYFGGTGYLGLASHPEVIEAGCEALRRYGVHSATSRGRFGTNPPVLDVERRAAEFFGTEDAFYFGSGYVANHIMISAMAPGAEAILLDEACHYCVAEAARLPGLPVVTFHHADAADLRRAASSWKNVIVMADAVGPSDGVTAPVMEYLEVLRSQQTAVLLLDDAHGFGVLGDDGRGLLDELGRWNQANGGVLQQADNHITLAVSGTLAKAVGGYGGIIPGTGEFVEKVRRSSHYFDGSSAPASAVAGSTAKALEIMIRSPELRHQLWRNAAHLRAGLHAMGLRPPVGRTAHFGVALASAAAMIHIHEALKSRGILLPYIGTYSGIPPQGILRFAVFATHTPAQIDHLLSELRAFL